MLRPAPSDQWPRHMTCIHHGVYVSGQLREARSDTQSAWTYNQVPVTAPAHIFTVWWTRRTQTRHLTGGSGLRPTAE